MEKGPFDASTSLVVLVPAEPDPHPHDACRPGNGFGRPGAPGRSFNYSRNSVGGYRPGRAVTSILCEFFAIESFNRAAVSGSIAGLVSVVGGGPSGSGRFDARDSPVYAPRSDKCAGSVDW